METVRTDLTKRNIWRAFDIPIIIAGFLVILPILGINRTTDFAIFCIFVLAFNILYGFMGRLSFGHMLYLGTGAYAVTLFSEHISQNPLLAILAALVAGALIGVILGPIIVRTTGACFALINLAFCQVGYFLVLVAFSRYTGGEDGMSAYFSKMPLLNFGNKGLSWVRPFSAWCWRTSSSRSSPRRLTACSYGPSRRTRRGSSSWIQYIQL
jgi:branched-chain amino acid transport system permease protein